MNTNNDLNFDFSSQGGSGLVTIDSFLDIDDINTPSGEVEETGVVDLDLTNLGNIVESDEHTPNVTNPTEVVEEVKPNPSSIDIELDDTIEITESGLDYKSVINKLVDSKLWQPIEGFEAEDGTEIPFDEVDIDEETFIDIFKQKLDEEKTKLNEGKVSVEGVSEFTKKLIEIEKNGGNVQQALESYQMYKHPLDGLDLSREEDQQAAVYLKFQAAGLKDKEIIDVIKAYKSNGELEDKANEAKLELDSAFEQQLSALNQEAIDRKTQQKEALKTYRNDLGENLKTFEVNDTYRRKLLDIASKEDTNGRFELDNIYSEKRRNPKEAAELVLFLTDKEEYIKQVTKEVVRERDLGTMKKLKLVTKGAKSSIKIDTKEDNKDKNFLDLKDI